MFQEVEISSIDLKDQKYKYGTSHIPEELARSIDQLGILNPVKLLRSVNGYTVITGWKRILLCHKQKKSKLINALVFDQDGLSETDIILISIYDNYGRLNDLEKAELLKMLRVYADLSKEDIAKNYMPLLGIPGSYRNYEKYLALADLSDEIKESYYSEKYSIEHLFLLSDMFNPDERTCVYRNTFDRYRLNLNESREILKNIKEIALRERIGIYDIMDEIFCSGNSNITKSDFRTILKKRRNPLLGRLESEFRNLMCTLDTGENISLFHHPYFETNDLELRIRIKNSDELKNSLELLNKEIKNGKIDSLLDFIKKGVK